MNSDIVEKFRDIEVDVLRARYAYDRSWKIDVYKDRDGNLKWFAIDHGSTQPLDAGERHLAYLRCGLDIAAVWDYDRTGYDGREMTDSELIDALFDGADYDHLLDYQRDMFRTLLHEAIRDEASRRYNREHVRDMLAKMED